jgi:hypothetical protein
VWDCSGCTIGASTRSSATQSRLASSSTLHGDEKYSKKYSNVVRSILRIWFVVGAAGTAPLQARVNARFATSSTKLSPAVAVLVILQAAHSASKQGLGAS